ncbi:MAG TPA: hypothetical protein VJW20_00990 [Candidatus Angelobacter sp.]|nr:hypothetical protein [Candidatus Angelobacter sp.]
MKLSHLIIALVLLLGASACFGDDLADIKRACFERGNFHKGIYWAAECAQETFTAEQYHFTLTSVAPGAGFAALGLGTGSVQRIRRFEFMFAASAAMVPVEGSSVGQAQMTFALPTLSFMRVESPPHSTKQKYGLRAINRRPIDDPVDAKMSVTLRVRRINPREQDFYGLGPSTTRAGLASYGLILTETYAGVNNPLTSWSSAGFDFSFLQPRVTSSINAAPPIRSAYSEATAPGLTVRDDFLHYEPYLLFRIPSHRSFFTTMRVGYAFYQAMGDSRLSFQRLSASSSTTIPLWIPAHNTSMNRGWFANAICPDLRSGTRCSMGDLTLNAVVAASYTGAGSQVPFYFDQTLGGTDMNGNDTLRGFGNYRFRGPNTMLFQSEYRHYLWGPVGLLLFYDTGKVALQRSDLSFDHLQHDFGPGLYFHIGNRELVRLYVGFGGEVSRLNKKFSGSF